MTRPPPGCRERAGEVLCQAAEKPCDFSFFRGRGGLGNLS
ncbi:hypothetical protein [Azospirillum argentinense]